MRSDLLVRGMFNYLRSFILYLASGKRIKIKNISFISILARVKVVSGKVNIASRVEIEPNTLIKASKGEINIKDNVYINRNCLIVSHKSITIHEETTIGPNTCIYDHDHNIAKKKENYKIGQVLIGKNVWIGANCIILKGVTIGDNSVIAAGTIITKDVPANTLVYQERKSIEKLIKG